MTTQTQTCCTTPASWCYWFSVSLVAWGALSLIGLFWYPLHPSSAATFLLAGSVGCAANWLRNRTLHCAFTAPLFFVAGIVFLLSGMGVFAVHARLIWPIVVIGVGIALLLEWRYTTRP